MLRKLSKLVFRVGLAIAVLIALSHGCDRILDREMYKTCLQIPKEVRKYDDCEQFRP
jgi:hypothetical protein